MENLESSSGIATTDTWLKATEGMKIDAFEATSLAALTHANLENSGSSVVIQTSQPIQLPQCGSAGTSDTTPSATPSNPKHDE